MNILRRSSKRSGKKAIIELPKAVMRVVSKGKPYFYFQSGRGSKNVGKRIRLPDDPASPEFWQAYTRLLGLPFQGAPRKGTFDALISDYKRSPEFAKKAPRTKELNNNHLKIISELWGDHLVCGIRARHVLELRDAFATTPRKADHLVSMISTLMTWAIPRDFIDINPCREIGKISGGDGWSPWNIDDIGYAQENLPRHLWWPAALAVYTGQRQSDVLAMNWNAIAHGEISVRQAKTGKPLIIPIHKELKPILENVPRLSTRILTNSRGMPWASGFKAAWQDAMNTPAFKSFRERRLVFHGLRKSSVVMLLEAGCTDAEVAAITGQSRQMVEHYSIMVNQRKLARAAILKWEASNKL